MEKIARATLKFSIPLDKNKIYDIIKSPNKIKGIAGMEKRKIIAIISFIAGSLVLFFSIFFTVAHFTFAYYEKGIVFHKSGLSITLTHDFKEKDVLDYTAYYSSQKILVLTSKAEFDDFNIEEWNPAEHSLYEYAEKIAEDYKNLYPSTSEIYTEHNLIYFTFDFEKNGNNYTYLLAVFKSNDAYWQVSLGCKSVNFARLQSDMIRFAQSVSMEE